MASPAVRVLGLFAGIGGLERGVCAGLRDVGRASKLVGLVEGEAFGAACLAAAMRRGDLDPCPIWLGDVREFPAAAFAGAVDLVVAGFPCQPASSAGKRRGTDDERWIWPEVVRVAKESRARYLFLENVRGLLNVNGGEGFAQVLEGMADLGLDAEWTVLPASAVGAPHRRERVFILGRRGVEDADRCDSAWIRSIEPSREGRLSGADRRTRLQNPPGRLGGQFLDRPDGTGRHLADGELPGLLGRGPAHDGPDEADAPGHDAHGCDQDVGDAEGLPEREPHDEARAVARDDARGDARGAGGELADGGCTRRGEGAEVLRGRQSVAPHRGSRGFPLLWPPGPGERDLWQRIIASDPALAPATAEPDFCRVAPKLPEGMDRSGDVGRPDDIVIAARSACADIGFGFDPCSDGDPERWDVTQHDGSGSCMSVGGLRDWLLRVADDPDEWGLSGDAAERLREALADAECRRLGERTVETQRGGAGGRRGQSAARDSAGSSERSARVDRLRALGNAVVAAQARAAFAGLWRRLHEEDR